MGVGVNSSNSSANNNFSSQPTNLQYPQYQGMANPVSAGLSNAIWGANAGGMQGAQGQQFSPYVGSFGAFNDPNQNPLVAPVTGQQTGLMNQAAGMAAPNFFNAQNTGSALQANQFAQGNPLQQAFGTNSMMLNPNYAASLATSPQTQGAISSAVNPMIQSFNAQTVPGLQGMFTAAGQRVNSSSGVGGSSAFDRAGANAMTGLESQIGSTAGGIANQAYQTGLQQQSNAVNQAGTLSGQNVSNLINAATGSQGVLTSQLNDTINALNANALPQLTQQYGINQGLSLYQTQVNQLMTALGLGAQASQPAIGNIAKGSGRSSSKGGGISI